MNSPSTLSHAVAAAVIVLPTLSALAIGLSMLISPVRSERLTAAIARIATVLSFVASLVLFGLYRSAGQPLTIDYGPWFSVHGYEFRVDLLIDKLSLLMLLVSKTILVLVGRFSVRYLHREPGFHRFFLLLSTFSAGMSLLVLSDSYDLLFAGWEIVGVASMLLIAFFDERKGPVAGALRAMISYRIADVGLLAAGVMLHDFLGSAEFEVAFGGDHWPHATTALPTAGCTWVVLALLLAVMGKSAQFPLSGWLPRAMEGPTPSSALFYGALSVHAGVYLLLRSSPLIESSTTASIAIGIVGALSALSATLTGRTQSDAKTILAYATITQVGLMLVEISFHLWNWVLVHMVAHASLRLFQLLRAPSALRDAQELHAALRRVPKPRPGLGARLLSSNQMSKLYLLARQRFFLDAWLERIVVAPVLALGRYFDGLERVAIDGVEALEPAPSKPPRGTAEEAP